MHLILLVVTIFLVVKADHRKTMFHLPLLHVGSSLVVENSESCSHVIILSPEVRVKPSAQSTKTSAPFLRGNIESVIRFLCIGNSVQVPVKFDTI